jgi:glycosyl transferase family 87
LALTRNGKLKVLFAYLVVSAAAVRGMPAVLPWGADFQNLHAYQLCAHDRDPYLMAGAACGDVYKRDLVYPPLLFHSFFWVRHLSLESAMYVWTALMVLVFAGCFYAWSRLGAGGAEAKDRWDVVVFCVLLMFQGPSIFLFERGGTDGAPLLLWTVASYLFCRRKLGMAGIVAGAAAAYKLYPAIPCGIITWALLAGGWRKGPFRRTDFVRFGASALAAFVALNVLFLRDARTYFGVALPKFAKVMTLKNEWSHAIPAFVGPDHTLYAKFLLLMLLVLWCWSASQSLFERPALTFAGALAMSTFFAATSWDYNLVTTFPLLLLLFLEARRTDRWGTLAFGLVAIVGDRPFFADLLAFLNPTMHLALEVAWLVVAAVEIARPSDAARSSEVAPPVEA